MQVVQYRLRVGVRDAQQQGAKRTGGTDVWEMLLVRLQCGKLMKVRCAAMFAQLDDSLPFGDFKGSTPAYKAALASVMGSYHKDAQTYEGKGPVAFL